MKLEELENNFSYHAPNPDWGEDKRKHHMLARATCLVTAKEIFQLCPDCAERTLAIRKVEEAMMWTNAAIARHPLVRLGEEYDR